MSPGGLARSREVLSDALLSWLFPARCVGCGEFETFLCARCRSQLQPVGAEVCVRCGQPGVTWSSPPWCPACVGRSTGYASARSAFLYEGVARKLVVALKSHGLRAVAPVMAELAAASFTDLLESSGADMVTWVPAHRSSHRERGYNQAEVLARSLARAAGSLPVIALARKGSRTKHQRALSREARQHNVQGVFAAEPGSRSGVRIGTKGVVLVDDVYTTGATAGEVAGVVARSTGLPVHVFTFCRAVAALREASD